MASPQEQQIVQTFMQNVYGKKADVSRMNSKHDGNKGHWLERQMGITHNASNAPDLLGFEMKNQTTSKTTFGDWSPSYFIFNDKEIIPREKGIRAVDRRDTHFLTVWGQPNVEKENRLSWSGKPIPKIDQWNDFGCILLVNQNNDIEIEETSLLKNIDASTEYKLTKHQFYFYGICPGCQQTQLNKCV